jgi:hypothetical protein
MNEVITGSRIDYLDVVGENLRGEGRSLTGEKINRVGDDEWWVLIEGFGGDYEVSSEGRVRTRKIVTGEKGGGMVKQFVSRVGKNEYLAVWLCDERGVRVKNVRVHRLVATAFLSFREGKTTVRFKDGDRMNCRADNLVVTEKVSIEDWVKSEKNLRVSGKEHWSYGKPKSLETRERMRASKLAKQKDLLFEVNGVGYASIKGVARYHRVHPDTVRNRLKSGDKKWRRWVKLDPEKKIVELPASAE